MNSRRNPRLQRTTILVLASTTLVIIIHLAGWWRPIQIVVDGVTTPIVRSFTGFTRWVGGGLSTAGSLGTLARDNAELSRQLSERDAQIASLREVEAENQLLRTQLGFQKDQPLNLVGAHVIGYSPDNVRRNLVIDRGARDGIKVGQAVVSSGVLIGKVEHVNDHTAQIFLVTDPEFRVQAMGQSGRARGIIRGQLGSGLRFEQIAQNEKIDKDEYVISAGSDLVPKGLLIGRVETVDRSDNEIFQAASVKSLVDVSRLELVYVVQS